MIIVYIILGLLLLYILSIMPRMRKKADLQPFLGRYYAHRGLHNNSTNSPENSLPAFLLAMQGDYGIELDVQLTKDAVAVVFHDFDLKRMCGIDKKVNEVTFEELKGYRLLNTSWKIPRFSEVLEMIDGRVPLIIELKIKGLEMSLCPVVVEELKNYNGIYCVESFNPISVWWYRKNQPLVMRGQLSSDFVFSRVKGEWPKYFVMKNLMLNFLTQPDFISYCVEDKDNVAFKWCKAIYNVSTVGWTARSQKQLDDAKKDFDLFIFDSFIPK